MKRTRLAATVAALFGLAVSGAAWASHASRQRAPSLIFPVRVCAERGRVVVADSVAKCLFVWNGRSRRARVIPLEGKPLGLAVSRRPRLLLVGNATHGRVDCYSLGGRFLGSLKSPVGLPQGIAVADAEKLVFVTDAADHTVKVFDLRSRALKRQFGGYGGGPGEFNYPSGIAYDPARGRVVVADLMNRRLQVFDIHGNWIRSITRGGALPMVRPQGVAVDRAGNIYVADSLWAGVYVFDAEGEPLDVLGEYGAGRSQVRTPLDVEVLPGGKVLVADYTNRRITPFPPPALGGVQ